MSDNSQRRVRLTEVFTPDGKMVKIVAEEAETGRHVLDVLWDPNDDQDPQLRDEFRQWAIVSLARKGYSPIN
jgi:hypothetical protein